MKRENNITQETNPAKMLKGKEYILRKLRNIIRVLYAWYKSLLRVLYAGHRTFIRSLYDRVRVPGEFSWGSNRVEIRKSYYCILNGCAEFTGLSPPAGFR